MALNRVLGKKLYVEAAIWPTLQMDNFHLYRGLFHPANDTSISSPVLARTLLLATQTLPRSLGVIMSDAREVAIAASVCRLRQHAVR